MASAIIGGRTLMRNGRLSALETLNVGGRLVPLQFADVQSDGEAERPIGRPASGTRLARAS